MRDFFLMTERIGFSHWQTADRPLAISLWGDPAVTRYIAQDGRFTPDQIDARLREEIERQRTYGVQYYPIFLRSDQTFLGCCGLRPWDGPEDALELGFHLCAPHWGHGYATEAARAIIRYAFDTLGTSLLMAGHHPDNHPSQALLVKLGFCYLRDAYYPPTGRNHPTYQLTR